MKLKDIETNRLILKQTTFEDRNEIFKLLSDEEVVRYLNLNIHLDIQDTDNLLKEYFEGMENNTKFPYTIIDKESKKFVGIFLIKLDLYNEEAFEFTIYLSKEFWGKGIYKEILPYMIKVAFEEIKTKNFRGYAKERNIASIKVLEKSNFILEKIFEVDGIEEKIYSFLITEEMYKRMV